MKAVLFYNYGPPEVLQLKEVEKPVPKDNEVLLKIRAAAITMGDCEMRSPKIPSFTWFLARLYFGLRKPRLKILGSYLAGEVETVGAEVKSFKKGDQLFGISHRFGAFAEYICLSEKYVLSGMPSNMTFEEAAPVGLGLDSLHFLKKAGIKKEDTVLINGAGGGIGTYALQLAKYYGAKVTVVDSNDKLEMLRSLGADAVIDYQEGDFTKSGTTYDIVFDVVGALSHRRSVRLLNKNGRYISAIPLLSRLLPSLWVSWTTGKKMMTGLANPHKEDLDYLKDLIEAGHLKTVIERHYGLEEVAEAHRYIEKGEKKGNVVVKID
ncbi:NAD(P)-dependent alcohol dehydrogenase [Muriicola sp. Z0-33]|uniref:NAD(P)-dependent alcohol dehydrogenase n=1 Tax=Muriicola sp. Z0-33 TaxID=2816957 RepID=UPI0022384869|nr:NAD(P)-dependent alcohol dehydrogenase [Muriicola sp. Z0-33]MCW5515705.1 NAD(P)-dependent alcohol dehydrogenase [Muriicola sp. Z0-33]